MPSLQWASKSNPEPIPGALELDSIIYPQGAGYPHSIPGDQLVLGDNLAAMSALLPDYEGSIQLIYADPPFFTNRRYPTRVGQGEDSRRPQDWKLAEGYADHWTDLDAYLDMLYPRLVLMHRLLAPNGSLYLHLDWHADSYARLLLDEIFGAERLLNEIVWVYHGPSPVRSAFNRKHDIILVYTKSDDYIFNVDAVRTPYDPNTVKTFESSPKAGFGKVPDLKRGKVPEDWWYFPVVARLHTERTGYPTQKPEALLERIILASSNPGDLVADLFCGSGTTAIVAQRFDRRYIMVDAAWRALHTSCKRLVSASAPPFSIQRATGYSDAQSIKPAHRAVNTEGYVIKHAGGGNTCSFWLDPAINHDLDYWEIDPNWDGLKFRSAGQAIRPPRKGAIPTEISLPIDWIGKRAAARYVENTGQQGQIELRNPFGD